MAFQDCKISEVIQGDTEKVQNVHSGKANTITHEFTCYLLMYVPMPMKTQEYTHTHRQEG